MSWKFFNSSGQLLTLAESSDISAHTGDTSDAHDASAISFTPAGTIAATDVQAAIEEVASEGGGGGAPTDADYLVGTANGSLSAEIVVGTSPGGELGGTWASPTVDATHSGSTHSAATDTHIADATDAHDASAISVLDTAAKFTGTDVEAVLAELDDSISAGGIPATIVDAKGDSIIATAADTVAREPVGANGSIIVAASGETTGRKWRLNNDGAAAAPAVTDDSGDGYSIGSRWLDTTNDKEYVATDVSVGAAVWKETTAAGGAATFSGARVHHGSVQAIDNITWTSLLFGSERFDTDAYHDIGSNTSRLTVPSTGYYLIGANVGFAANATGHRYSRFWLNGTTRIGGEFLTPGLSGGVSRLNVTTLYALTATDYVEVQVFQDSGSTLNTEVTTNSTPEFYIYKIGE